MRKPPLFLKKDFSIKYKVGKKIFRKGGSILFTNLCNGYTRQQQSAVGNVEKLPYVTVLMNDLL